MGRVVLMSGSAAAVALGLGLTMYFERDGRAQPLAYQGVVTDPEPAPATAPMVEFDRGRTGSALATAAFGLAALQPETYDGDMVVEIIEASPLEYAEKDRLTARLLAAEAGHGKLRDVLEDIRVSLAVE